MKKLLTRGESSPKIRHGDLDKYEAAILHLLPHTEGGFTSSVCPWSTPGCRATCLNYAGRGQMKSVHDGRKWKSVLYRERKSDFIDQLYRELDSLAMRAMLKRRQACVRLDGTSDLGLAEGFAPKFPMITFYDYTKGFRRMQTWLEQRRTNRHLTFSRSESNWRECAWVLHHGGNVAVVFGVKKGVALPCEWGGYPVIDGDLHDFRFLDPPGGGRIVGVRAKGRARQDLTGFVAAVN